MTDTSACHPGITARPQIAGVWEPHSRPTPIPKERWADWLAGTAVWTLFLCVPFAMLSWLVPFVSAQTIGNDYTIFGIGAQIDVMWSVYKGTFPLYMPGFAGGHSTAALTLGQLYHPLSWLSSLLPGYWEGRALECSTCVRLLSLGATHLVWYRLCRRLGVPRWSSFLATFAAVYNLRMLDSFRYGPSLESYTGMLLVAAACGFVYLNRGSRSSLTALALCVSLLMVSGHPQWMYMGAIGSGCFALCFPWIAHALAPNTAPLSHSRSQRYAIHVGAGFGAGMLLSAPYLLTFYFEFYRGNIDRVANPYSWTLDFSDNLRGEFCNFLFPLHADVHGAFGGSALFLLAALFPLAFAVGIKIPKVLWVLYAGATFAVLFAAGSELWVHRFVVEHVPLFRSFRVPGRITLWIPLFALPVLAWLMLRRNRQALGATAACGLVLVVWNWAATDPKQLPSGQYTPISILAGRLPPGFDQRIVWLSAMTLLLILLASLRRAPFRPLLALAAIGVLASTWCNLRNGTWKADKPRLHTFQDLERIHKTSVEATADPGLGMELASITQYRRRGLPLNRPLGSIAHRVERVTSEEAMWNRMKSSSADRPLLIDSTVAPLSPTPAAVRDEATLVYNTSNRFVFSVAAARDGYFVLGQARLPGFVARLDGRRVPIATADGLYPSIFLPRGSHRVEFRFLSWPFLCGVAIAFIAAAGCLWWLFRPVRRRILFATSVVVAGALLACGLELALYRGPSFGTSFHWQTPLGESSQRS
jgi:hypothetical protein